MKDKIKLNIQEVIELYEKGRFLPHKRKEVVCA